ncbi:MAG: hypothetical protein KBH78_10885 [Candidatus Hydrogenedentes bacterium]|nr:hypothetical protein [Candidatus Hydrogenedentota bacterium]
MNGAMNARRHSGYALRMCALVLSCCAVLGFPAQCWCQHSPDASLPETPPTPPPDPATPSTGPVPGNVTLSNAPFVVQVPVHLVGKVTRVQAVNEKGEPLADSVPDGSGLAMFNAGHLGPGWYRLRFLDDTGTVLGDTTAAVLEPFDRPWDPARNPIAVDLAVSWLAPADMPDAMAQLTRLARLAGVGWTRDRLRWRDLQPEAGAWVETSTRYDEAASLQRQAGVEVLSVFHDLPPWARTPDGSPADLRLVYRFCARVAERFRGKISAWEPWNEANAGNFGGWPIHQMCAWQKAAFLGFKSGDPGLTVCWQPIAGANTAAQARGVLDSGVARYFDVYTIHNYDWAHSFADLWVHSSLAASGKPVWVTESDRGVAGDGSNDFDDLPETLALLKAKYLPQQFALAMASGASRIFHFILADYSETHGDRPIRFGLLRGDLTPRPAYVALAVAARELAGARCLGRRRFEDAPDLWAVGFRDRDPGRGDTLVMWAEREVDWPERGNTSVGYTLPDALREPARCVDYLGRSIPTPKVFTGGPVYLVYPRGTLSAWFDDPGERAQSSESDLPTLSRGVVLEAWFPGDPPRSFPAGWTPEYYPALKPGEAHAMRLAVYHLGDGQPIRCGLNVISRPANWQVAFESTELTLEPMDRVEVGATVTVPWDPGPADADKAWWIRLEVGGEDGTSLDTLAVAVQAIE